MNAQIYTTSIGGGGVSLLCLMAGNLAQKLHNICTAEGQNCTVVAQWNVKKS